MKRKILTFVSGFLTAAVIFTSVPAIAASINATFNGVNINIEGNNVVKYGENYFSGGVQVPNSILYNGTTYLPVRKVSEILGLNVSYDGGSKTVNISQKLNYTMYADHRSVPDLGAIYGTKWANRTDDRGGYFYYTSALPLNVCEEYGSILKQCGFKYVETLTRENGTIVYSYRGFDKDKNMPCWVMFGNIKVSDILEEFLVSITYGDE